MSCVRSQPQHVPLKKHPFSNGSENIHYLLPKGNCKTQHSQLPSQQKTAFLTAQSSRCSEMVRDFIEWAAAWPFGPNTLGILFQPSAAVGSTVYSLLCFKMEKKTVDRWTNDQMQSLQLMCKVYPAITGTDLNKQDLKKLKISLEKKPNKLQLFYWFFLRIY